MIMLYPREKIMFFLGPILTNRFPVWVPILIWFTIQLIMFPIDNTPIAYAAHLGGFTAGAGIAWAIRPMRTETKVFKRTDIEALKALCVTSSLKEMYDYALNARDVETMMIWIENILKNVNCPVCGSQIRMKGGNFECTDGHRV
jgi:hypothetical protein